MSWPQSSTYNKLGSMLLRIEQEFGLTPSSRSRVQVTPSGKAKDKKSRFFGGPKLAAG
jgi:phage terminase small subunit